jgi:hypothetical protein
MGFTTNMEVLWEVETEILYVHQVLVLAVPWLRRLVAGLSQCRPGFDSGSVYVGFVVDKVALGQVFPPSTWVFPCQFHSTDAPLQGKTKKTNHLH